MKHRPYPAYKPSGVGWLGDVPEHWPASSLGRFCRRYAGGTPDRMNEAFWDGGEVPWINSGAVNQVLISEPSAFITAEGFRGSSARWVPKGAPVMALAGQGRTKGMVAQLSIEATCNQSMAAILPSPRIESRYLFWLLTAQYRQIRSMAGDDLRDGLNLETVGNIPILVPPLAEQRDIAAFLDAETAKIDTLIEKKQALIEKLNEQRTALISRTVTRGLPPDAARAAGLDPHARLKPSGVEWLGEIPEHWSVKRLRYVGEAIIGLTYNPADLVEEGEGTLVLRSSNIVRDRISLKDNVYVRSSIPSHLRTRDGDILVCSRNGSRALIGKNALLNREVAGLTWGAFMTVFRSPLNSFLYYVFNSSLFDYQSGAFATSTINQLTVGVLSSFEVPIPPALEQSAISRFLESEDRKVDASSSKVEAAIESLREYRSALITAAVTGKIDVRHHTP